MVDLVHIGALQRDRALRAARMMHEANTLHIHSRLLQVFEKRLGN